MKNVGTYLLHCVVYVKLILEKGVSFVGIIKDFGVTEKFKQPANMFVYIL